MAKLSQVLRDQKRNQLIEKYASKRGSLRDQLKDVNLSPEDKFAAMVALNKLPRNSCPTRKTRRCVATGRARAVYRKFGLSRIMLRELGLRGEIPGLIKSSW